MGRETAPYLKLADYGRVSTARPVRSGLGLGLEAQRKTIDEFARSRDADVLARSTEVESVRKADGPEPAKALKLAGTTLAIAELDRLGRNTEAFAEALAPTVEGIRTEGHTTLRPIAGFWPHRALLLQRTGVGGTDFRLAEQNLGDDKHGGVTFDPRGSGRWPSLRS